MKKITLKTTIQCSNCLSKVASKLEQQEGIHAWHVDLKDPNRTLTVETDTLTAEAIQRVVLQAGFLAQEDASK
ncbi:MAG: heavy-metal-associated domain-containing protein [Bacteroidota bacterium]|jgi:copper chaperone|nr:heavy-metal-associated domain-containing protein [Algoriphagus sp.]